MERNNSQEGQRSRETSLSDASPPCHQQTGLPCPPEILLQIFHFLHLESVCASACVSSTWRAISMNESLWRHLCRTTCNSEAKLKKHTWREATLKLRLHSMLEESKFLEYKKQLEHWQLLYSVKCDNLNSPPLKASVQVEDLPLHIQQYKNNVGFKQHPGSSKSVVAEFSLDLAAAAKDTYCLVYACKSRERGFWTTDTDYLKGAMNRYFKFMKLKHDHPNLLLIPTMDIEYIWRSHMIRPSVYQKDCLKYFGRVIDHKIRLTRYETLIRTNAIKETANLWRDTYDEEYGIDIRHIPEQPVAAANLTTPEYDFKHASGTWNGSIKFPHRSQGVLDVELTFEADGGITGNGKDSEGPVELNGSWNKAGEVQFTLSSSSPAEERKSVFSGTFTHQNFIDGVVQTQDCKGRFRISKQMIPSGVWEGYVQWSEGTFNGHPLNRTPEKMCVFLVFDHQGGIYGGGTQGNDYFEVRISGTYDFVRAVDVQWTKLTLQRATGTMNGCNHYRGKYTNGVINGTITREGTNWLGGFKIAHCKVGLTSEMSEGLARDFVPPPPVITKLTTQVSYFEQLWKESQQSLEETKKECRQSFEHPELGITVDDVVADSCWLEYYCIQVYNGWYNYPNDEHLEKSLKAYEKTLFLAAKHPVLRETLYPTFSIDLVWQAHQMHPSEYTQDCKNLIGCELSERPSQLLDPREEPAPAAQALTNAWREEYFENMY